MRLLKNKTICDYIFKAYSNIENIINYNKDKTGLNKFTQKRFKIIKKSLDEIEKCASRMDFGLLTRRVFLESKELENEYQEYKKRNSLENIIQRSKFDN